MSTKNLLEPVNTLRHKLNVFNESRHLYPDGVEGARSAFDKECNNDWVI